MRTLACLSLSLLSAVASAASVHYTGTTDPAKFEGANLWYKRFPGDQYNGLFLKTTYDFTADPIGGTLSIAAWTVQDSNGNTVFTLPPVTPTLAPNSIGDWEATIGDKLLTLYPTYPLNVFVNFNPRPIITGSFIPAFPTITNFELNSLSHQLPEPSGLAAVALLAVASLRRLTVKDR